MNTDKAYLMGLLIGGGVFGNAEDVFRIKLPYKEWGSYKDNPQRAGEIAGNILRKVGPMFQTIYNLTVQYEASPSGTWTILCDGDVTELKSELLYYGIEPEGELRGNVNLALLVDDLVDDNLKRRFIAGLADTIGSMAKSHRRFSDEHQIISFEIKGFNFRFVCDLCHLLYSINCIPDQINWNHPNIHCSGDCYYSAWAKGFKLRILLDQYAKFGAFAFSTKAETSDENRGLQQNTHTAERCETREIRVVPRCVHKAEHDPRLPEEIRHGHYIHFRHFCAVLGCEHAPYDQINSAMEKLGDIVIPFPILSKDLMPEIDERIKAHPLMAERKYENKFVSVASLLQWFNEDNGRLMYGSKKNNGYPISQIMQAVAYVIANDDELFGKRPRKYEEVIKRHINQDRKLTVEMRVPDLLTPLVIVGNGRGALIGAANPDVYEKLIIRDSMNKYKIYVNEITEDDLRNG